MPIVCLFRRSLNKVCSCYIFNSPPPFSPSHSCECPPGFRGRDCEDREYCFWFTCPEGGRCRSLADGHECVANATFNGANSSVVYSPEFARSPPLLLPSSGPSQDQAQQEDEADGSNNVIEVEFRTKTNGTIIQV